MNSSFITENVCLSLKIWFFILAVQAQVRVMEMRKMNERLGEDENRRLHTESYK